MTYPPRKPKATITGLLLLVSILFIHPPLRADDLITSSVVLPEPRVVIPDLNMPEQIMSRDVQAALDLERSQPPRDASGRIHYIVDLVDDVDGAYPATTPIDGRLGDWHNPAMYGATQAFEAQYTFEATSMFSWVGKGFSAYLTPAQADALRLDSRVVRITEDRAAEFSAVWADQPLSGSEIKPWNITAVGGNKVSAGSVYAYVLDGGVGYHRDLTNVVSRESAAPLTPVVGCYPHATHVAGIISAPRNSVGVVGVDSSVPVVSVSVFPGANKNYNCGYGSPTHIAAGLDKIKALITARGRVGVINISMNTPDRQPTNLFKRTATLGQKLQLVATPAPGYPGAFIAQSAGNGAKNACNYAYDATSINDGIMVVGAIDINGQPVVKLNGQSGFRNNKWAGDEAGSNHGACVSVWAPGNNIYSTWAGVAPGAIQSGNLTYSNYALLSGTSMAAPHVAGVAAWLAETGNLTTPAQIEAAVRQYARANGAKDPITGSPLRMAGTSGVSYTAQPTAEFLIGGKVNSKDFTTDDATFFKLSYDSEGAQSCDLTGYRDGAVWYQHTGFYTAYDWGGGAVRLDPGNYRWVINCRSAANTTNMAEAWATVRAAPPAPSAAFFFNNEKQPDPALTGATNPWPSEADIKRTPYGTPFDFSYSSANTSTCHFYASRAASFKEFWAPWYDVPAMLAYIWPPLTLERGYYWWRLSCTGAGGAVTADFFAHVY